MPEVEIGRVSEFFLRPMVAGITLTGTLTVGDRLRIHGHTTDLSMTVESLQINNVPVQEAHAGQTVGMKVPDRARRGDIVYKITG